MPGAGRKQFTRERATSSDVQNYLMDQAVMVFASTSARDTQIPSPSDGMLVYCINPGAYYRRIAGVWLLDRDTGGRIAGNSNEQGVVSFNHGLPGVPSSVLITPAVSAIAPFVKYVVTAVSSLQVQVGLYDTRNGGVLTSNPADFYWGARL